MNVLDRLTATSRHIALLVAMVATCGSLFFSEVLRWIPCELCWQQRVLMYPLALILLVGIVIDDRRVHFYGLPLALGGVIVSLYHYLEVLKVLPPSPCLGGVPCSLDYLTPILTGPWSFIKIPFLALVAFSMISVMLGNYALAGAPATAPSARRLAISSAVGIVVATSVIFVLLGVWLRM
ncbi:MAG: disulfide bond formation protein B [Candidatus Viridilinea halotolerans]|uniref:Disulfide bond formation protein B n=1 Tax=Candidatus Viridilinea halotolerans TaxID=2491704 RepID=A0A426UAZ2_9CHLR|nr:MAG: disulfide bond formation protein B [Candidatus Viridilinea halotolerans]